MRAFVLIAALPLFAASLAVTAAQRAFVSTGGDDANAISGCSLAAPCRSFDTAIGAVATNGEVIALDSGGYGRFSVTKSVTVTAPPGVYAGISVFDGTNGVDINTAGVDVILRGLAINGQGGDNGINFENGASLVVENCTIDRMIAAGIAASAAGNDNDHPAKVQIVATTMSRNDRGLKLAGGPIAVTVTRSAITGNFAGIEARSTVAGVENALTVQSSTISNGTFLAGIDASATVAGAVMVAVVSDTTISRNTDNGIYATGSGQTLLTLAGNVMTGNYHGVSIAGPATVKAVLGENTISRNRQCGVFAGGTTLSRGDNTINDNVTCATTSPMGGIGGL